MNYNFSKVKLADVCNKIGSGATPRGGSKVYLDSGKTSLIRSQNVYNLNFEYDGLVYIEEEAAEKLSNVEVQPNDVLVNITGDSVARVCMVPEDVLPARVNQHVSILRPKKDYLDPRFLKYSLVTQQNQYKLLAIASAGGTRKALTKAHLEDFEIELPDLNYQLEVSEILDSFDQKIQLNQRVSKTLESIAQAIFKSWFVDFDPVRAKKRANQEGYDPERATMAAIVGVSLEQDWGKIDDDLEEKLFNMTDAQSEALKHKASLFPKGFEDSELGYIPRGWHLGILGEICSAQGGYAFKSKLFNDQKGNPVVKIKNIKEDFNVDLQDCQYLFDEDAVGKERYELSDGDYIIAMTGATVGKTGIVVSDSDKVLLNQRVAKFTSEKFDSNINWFIHSAFLATNFREKVEVIARGSAQPNISASGIESIRMVIPGDEIIKEFLKFVDPFFQKWITSTKESQHLRDLRDTLLPRLISGEISV